MTEFLLESSQIATVLCVVTGDPLHALIGFRAAVSVWANDSRYILFDVQDLLLRLSLGDSQQADEPLPARPAESLGATSQQLLKRTVRLRSPLFAKFAAGVPHSFAKVRKFLRHPRVM